MISLPEWSQNSSAGSVGCLAKKSEGSQQPKDDSDHNDNIEDTLDLAIHRQVIVDQIKNNANDNEADDQIDKRCHDEFLGS
jgi:hypothetical protein